MHLKLDSSGTIDDGDVARDLGQEPADIVVLSAADSDLAAFGAAYATLAGNFPGVRLTNLLALGHPASVDLYVERTLCRARIVVLRMPISYTSPSSPVGILILSPIWNGLSIMMTKPEIMFEIVSWAARPIASEPAPRSVRRLFTF